MLQHFCTAAAGVAFCCTSALSLAADFDGSKQLICATIETHDCYVGKTCQRGLPQSVGAPQFMRVDFANKTITGPYRTSRVLSVSKGEAYTVLQGIELGYGWTLAINSKDGSMQGSLVGEGNVIGLFGACTPA